MKIFFPGAPLIQNACSKFHLAIAQSFKAVDLPDEAIDEAQRSLRDNPGDVDAWLFQEQLFEQKNLPFQHAGPTNNRSLPSRGTRLQQHTTRERTSPKR